MRSASAVLAAAAPEPILPDQLLAPHLLASQRHDLRRKPPQEHAGHPEPGNRRDHDDRPLPLVGGPVRARLPPLIPWAAFGGVRGTRRARPDPDRGPARAPHLPSTTFERHVVGRAELPVIIVHSSTRSARRTPIVRLCMPTKPRESAPHLRCPPFAVQPRSGKPPGERRSRRRREVQQLCAQRHPRIAEIAAGRNRAGPVAGPDRGYALGP